ncbi:ACD11 homolog protein-like isoform X1 [Eucalyptus grandis]|uniref:ACD11 homolog protein-like isoform X1 n=1 Tax=Eucalyptus grandis TaxID=71139 RepID=UPI00052495B2|nr:ACD11 homolog protein-like isoform X1 [Eucalyptus grandis]
MDATQRSDGDREPSKEDAAAAVAVAVAVATPLSGIADAFEKLAGSLSGDRAGLQLDALCDACAPVSVLFGCLGIAFKFAEMEFVSKVSNLVEASKKYCTLEKIIDVDVANRTVKKQGSHTRNLRRVRLGLDLIRALFEQFLSSQDNSLKAAATTAYSQVCAPYHSWAVRTAAYAGMYALPSRDQLLLKLNENVHSAEKKMRRYMDAVVPVIEYIDKLYLSRDIRLDW